MSIELNHTIVPARDKVAAAKWFARILGLQFDEASANYFAPVRVNNALTLDFANGWDFDCHHYAFKVSDEKFDEVFARLKAEGILYESGPPNQFGDMKINHRGGGRGVYFSDPDGHVLELLTIG